MNKDENFWVSKSEQQTQAIAADIFNNLAPKKDISTVIGLEGELGVGKTIFVQEFSKVLRIPDNVTSPTFVIMKFYSVPKNQHGFEKLIHIDAYRLNNGQELLTLGVAEELQKPENLFLIEWWDKVADILPVDLLVLSFEAINEHTRTISARSN